MLDKCYTRNLHLQPLEKSFLREKHLGSSFGWDGDDPFSVDEKKKTLISKPGTLDPEALRG